MLLKNTTESSIAVRIDNVETTIASGDQFLVTEDKGEELLNNYPNSFAKVTKLAPNMLVKQGEGAPSTAPATWDLFYYDKTNKALYLATWTTASTDRKALAFVSEGD